MNNDLPGSAEYPLAQLCYVTQPGPDTIVLNLQFNRETSRVIEVTDNGSYIERVRLTKNQLMNILKDGMEFME